MQGIANMITNVWTFLTIVSTATVTVGIAFALTRYINYVVATIKRLIKQKIVSVVNEHNDQIKETRDDLDDLKDDIDDNASTISIESDQPVRLIPKQVSPVSPVISKQDDEYDRGLTIGPITYAPIPRGTGKYYTADGSLSQHGMAFPDAGIDRFSQYDFNKPSGDDLERRMLERQIQYEKERVRPPEINFALDGGDTRQRLTEMMQSMNYTNPPVYNPSEYSNMGFQGFHEIQLPTYNPNRLNFNNNQGLNTRSPSNLISENLRRDIPVPNFTVSPWLQSSMALNTTPTSNDFNNAKNNLKNRDIRRDIPIPKFAVGPWSQSTIVPDAAINTTNSNNTSDNTALNVSNALNNNALNKNAFNNTLTNTRLTTLNNNTLSDSSLGSGSS